MTRHTVYFADRVRSS